MVGLRLEQYQPQLLLTLNIINNNIEINTEAIYITTKRRTTNPL